MKADQVAAERTAYEAMVREIEIMQESLRALHGALDRKQFALFCVSVNTLEDQAAMVQSRAADWLESLKGDSL